MPTWAGYAAEAVVALIWVGADVYLWTHPYIEVYGTPWIPILIVTYFGAFFSYFVGRAVHRPRGDLVS